MKNEGYQGVKFKTELLSGDIPADPNIEQLKYWCGVFHKKNLAPPYPGGSFGNLSFRIGQGENEFIITGTCIGLKDDLGDDCFVKVTSCDMNSRTVFAKGTRAPSSESMLHYAIYCQRPDVNAIFHGHCKELLESAKRFNIPQTKREQPYGTVGLVNSVLEISGKNDFLIIKNHGFISLGNSMKEAGERSENILKNKTGNQ